MKLRIGTRGSALALAQTKKIIEIITKQDSKVDAEIVVITTTGDKILDKTLDKIGGKGLFIKELEEALLEKKVDLTVHSLKDMPMELSEKLPLLAISTGENPLDVLVLPKGKKELDFTKPIGTSSQRRTVQVKEIYPECTVVPVRGNVLTRLEKLDAGQFSGLILAYAGLKRLNLESRVHKVFQVDEMLPSGCQGVLAVQGRRGEHFEFLNAVHCEKTAFISERERGFLQLVQGGCSSPIAVHGTITGKMVQLRGMILDHDDKILKETVERPLEQAGDLENLLFEKFEKIYGKPC